MRIATMGINFIDPEKFDSEGRIKFNKPRFGLWGSTLITDKSKYRSSWMDWVISEDFHPERYTKGISYTLHKNTKIYTVDSVEDYMELLEDYSIRKHEYDNVYKFYIDWNKFKEDYDAFHLTEDCFYKLRFMQLKDKNEDGTIDIVEDFCFYDCESWIIFNLNCINKGSIQNFSIDINRYWN